MNILPKFFRREHYTNWYDEPEPEYRRLEDILLSNPTDKVNSGFDTFYSELFEPIRFTAREICEIGIAWGGSLRAWEEYFPKATIVGIDNDRKIIDRMQDEITNNRQYGTRIHIKWLDAGQPELKEAANRFYDVVIDDGSHEGIDIINAFAVLWPTVKEGGYYIVEDVGSSRPTPSMACDYFADHIYGTIVGDSLIDNIVFRPNMIVVQKK